MELTLSEIIADIPTDGSAIVVYMLMFLFVMFTVLGSRNKERPSEDSRTSRDQS